MQVPLHQDVDGVVEGGGEEQALGPSGVWSSRRLTAGRKPRSAMWSASSSTVTSTAEVGVARPMRSSSRPGQAMTMSTPSRSLLYLRPGLTPPKMVTDRRSSALASGRQRRIDLCDEFAGRGEDQCTRTSGPARGGAIREPGHDGQQEGVGLAGAGAAAAEHVAPCQRIRQCRSLNGEGGLDAGGGEGGNDGRGQAEAGEGGMVVPMGSEIGMGTDKGKLRKLKVVLPGAGVPAALG